VIHISHLLFADHSVFFCGKPHALFLCFKVVYGLKINLTKSELVPVGNVSIADGLASIMGCTASSLPIKYLGL
jgi:hypothetical protein